MSKRTPKTYPIYGEANTSIENKRAKAVGKGSIHIDYKSAYKKKCENYEALQAAYKELMATSVAKKTYSEIMEVYNNLSETCFTQEQYQEVITKCEELIAANKSCAEQLTAENHNVELLKQQIQNNSAYIGRLNEVIALLNLQIFKK